MKKLLAVLLVCSCAHAPKITFADGSGDQDTVWACLREKSGDYQCIEYRAFLQMLAKQKPAVERESGNPITDL